jgi:hypothetical protein
MLLQEPLKRKALESFFASSVRVCAGTLVVRSGVWSKILKPKAASARVMKF